MVTAWAQDRLRRARRLGGGGSITYMRSALCTTVTRLRLFARAYANAYCAMRSLAVRVMTLMFSTTPGMTCRVPARQTATIHKDHASRRGAGDNGAIMHGLQRRHAHQSIQTQGLRGTATIHRQTRGHGLALCARTSCSNPLYSPSVFSRMVTTFTSSYFVLKPALEHNTTPDEQ